LKQRGGHDGSHQAFLAVASRVAWPPTEPAVLRPSVDVAGAAVVAKPLMGSLKPQSNGPLYSNTVIGTLVVDGWTVTFGTARTGLGECTTNFMLFDTARRGLGGLRPRAVPSSLYQI